MASIEVRHTYTNDADTVWQKIRDFGDLSWLPGVQGCELEGDGVGAVRTVLVFDGSKVQEKLTAFDDAARSFSYHIIAAKGVPADADYHATVQVHPADTGCEIHWQAHFNDQGYPADKVDKARAQAEQMYSLCLMNLENLLK